MHEVRLALGVPLLGEQLQQSRLDVRLSAALDDAYILGDFVNMLDVGQLGLACTLS